MSFNTNFFLIVYLKGGKENKKKCSPKYRIDTKSKIDTLEQKNPLSLHYLVSMEQSFNFQSIPTVILLHYCLHLLGK